MADAITSNQVSWKKKWFRTVKPQGPEQITYGDKVIWVRNHERIPYSYRPNGEPREKEYVANGEIGLVTGQIEYGHANPKFVNVEFSGRDDRSFGFSRSAFRDDGQPLLELAYAVTVHKAQGSQFGVVVLVLPAHSRLLSREMIYTRSLDKPTASGFCINGDSIAFWPTVTTCSRMLPPGPQTFSAKVTRAWR